MYKGFLVYAGEGAWLPYTANLSTPQYGCGTYDVSSNTLWAMLNADPEVDSVILLVDRNLATGSGCTFSEKVYNAQMANAKVGAVLIADTQEGTPWPTYMKGDSLGKSVNIASMFVQKAYGDAIRKAAQDATDPQAIRVQLEFFVPNPDDRVEYDLYYNILSPKSLTFLQTYGTVARVFKQRAFFTPHWQVQSCGAGLNCAANCLTTTLGTTPKNYCLYPTTGSTSPFAGISGIAALQEMLRQQCIFNLLSQSTACPNTKAGCDNYTNYWGWVFWSYIEMFYAQCMLSYLDPTFRFSAQCSQNVVAAVNQLPFGQPAIDWNAVTTCASWSSTQGSIPLLDTMVSNWTATGPFFEPFLYVNMYPYNGDVACKTPITEDTCGILSMMCYGYQNSTDPLTGLNRYPIECSYPSNCPFGTSSCSQQIVTTTERSGISAGAVVGIVLAFLFIAGVVGYYFHRRSQDRSKAEVDALLKQYLPMDPGQTHGVAQGSAKLREQHERRLIQDMDLEDQELETSDEV